MHSKIVITDYKKIDQGFRKIIYYLKLANICNKLILFWCFEPALDEIENLHDQI